MIESLHLRQFTAFEELSLAFCPGINVFVGANATGKTHLLKVMYAVTQAFPRGIIVAPELELASKLSGVFRPAEGQLKQLVRRPWAGDVAGVEMKLQGAGRLHFGIADDFQFPSEAPWDDLRCLSSVFLPTREMVTLAPWLPSLYRKREVEVDETEADLCEALLLPRLKELSEEVFSLFKPLEQILGGEVVLEDQRFRIAGAGAAPDLEATLLAEGHRKLAGLVQLVRNGSLDAKTVVFWDEPEASLNPELIPVVVEVIRSLAAAGTQLFITTHDYLLSQQLSLLAEENEAGTPSIRFFGLHREGPDVSVTAETGDTLADIERNPILDGFLRHRRLETAAFARGA